VQIHAESVKPVEDCWQAKAKQFSWYPPLNDDKNRKNSTFRVEMN